MNRPTNKRRYNAAIRDILKTVLNGNDLSRLDQWETEIAVECAERGFITKPKYAARTEDGVLHAEFAKPKLLAPGMEFLYNRHPNRRANIALVISGLALLVSVLSNGEKITDTVQSILEVIKSVQSFP